MGVFSDLSALCNLDFTMDDICKKHEYGPYNIVEDDEDD